MRIETIRGDADYRAMLKEIGTLMDAEPGTARGSRLDALVTLIEVWEREHFPLNPSSQSDTTEPGMS